LLSIENKTFKVNSITDGDVEARTRWAISKGEDLAGEIVLVQLATLA
jgi:hypothetical protein